MTKDENAHPSVRCACGTILYGCAPDRMGEVVDVRCSKCGSAIRFRRTLTRWTASSVYSRRRSQASATRTRPPAGARTDRDSS